VISAVLKGLGMLAIMALAAWAAWVIRFGMR
jgi:hypothetical protein